jgi:hypothetical protein
LPNPEAKELATEIPGYQIQDGKVTNDINARLVVLTEKEAALYRKPDWAIELWYSRGLYKGRLVKPYPGRPWFKVFHNFECKDGTLRGNY